jgi:hypothetical protein
METRHWKLIDGEPVPCDDFLEWARWFETADRIIQQDRFGEVLVSTVFLGLDHGFGDDGPPVLFETMIFRGEHDGYQTRARSRLEALAQHQTALELINGA